MKKTKKVIKRIPKLAIAFSILFALVISYIMPIKNVLALDETYELVITFNVADSSDAVLAARDANGILASNNLGDGFLIIRGEQEHIVEFEDSSNHERFDHNATKVLCTSNKSCTVTLTVPTGHGAMYATPGDASIGLKLGPNDYHGENITDNETLTVVNNDSIQNHPNDEENPGFDGKAYLIWSCGNGTCYHYFDNIPVTLEGGVFYKASEIKDDNNGKIFDVKAEIKGFALKDRFEEWVTKYKANKNISEIDWSKLDTSLIVGNTDMREYEEAAEKEGACSKENVVEEDFHNCVDNYVESKGIFTMHADLQPVGEPYSANAYVSYGDRNFKVIIYNDSYRGVTIGSLDDLTYYPAIWENPFLRVESYDISETTKEKPMDIDTVLLESTVNIKTLSEYNDFVIKSMEALDVPNDAVIVTKTEEGFKINFKSNFYDKVIFKVTDSSNKVYYIRINREIIGTNLEYRDNRPVLLSTFYFDRNTTYSDYIITAKIVYKDGTSKKVEMTNTKEIDDGLGNKTYAYEVDEEKGNYGPKGKGLKVSSYKYNLTEDELEKISKVYINVEKAGSTETNYAGAYVGSGKGVILDFEEER